MQNRTKLFATCALPVMLGLGILAGCQGQTPGAAQSEISIKQLAKAGAGAKATDKSNNVVTPVGNKPVVNKPGTGTVSFNIVGLAARKVLYARADIGSILIYLDNDGAGADAQRVVTAAEITTSTPNVTMNNVAAGSYTAFVTAFDGPNPQTDNNINVGGNPATGNVTVVAGNTANLTVGLTLADTPATVGSVSATVIITDGN